MPNLVPLEEEEDDFDFIAIDDFTGGESSTSSSSHDLHPIEEQPSKSTNSDLAASILEGFFYGSNATPKTSTKQEETPHQEHGNTSPRSTILNSVCSCPQVHGLLDSPSFQHCYQSSSSLPASPLLLPPKKRPSLKKIQSTASMSSAKRNVSFTDISVREYDVELSDHPSCSFGPPIQLGWAYEETETTSVEDYEVTRSPQRKKEVHELVLSYYARRRRLKQSGYKRQEIKNAQREVDRIKRERLITEFFLPAARLDETLERVLGNVKGWFRPRPAEEEVYVCRIHSPQLGRSSPTQQ